MSAEERRDVEKLQIAKKDIEKKLRAFKDHKLVQSGDVPDEFKYLSKDGFQRLISVNAKKADNLETRISEKLQSIKELLERLENNMSNGVKQFNSDKIAALNEKFFTIKEKIKELSSGNTREESAFIGKENAEKTEKFNKQISAIEKKFRRLLSGIAKAKKNAVENVDVENNYKIVLKELESSLENVRIIQGRVAAITQKITKFNLNPIKVEVAGRENGKIPVVLLFDKYGISARVNTGKVHKFSSESAFLINEVWDDFIKWFKVSGFSGREYFIYAVFKPSGLNYYKLINLFAYKNFFKIGFEPVSENKGYKL